MLVEAGNKLVDGGGRRCGIGELDVVATIGLKEVGDVGLAPDTFRLETAGRVVK